MLGCTMESFTFSEAAEIQHYSRIPSSWEWATSHNNVSPIGNQSVNDQGGNGHHIARAYAAPPPRTCGRGRGAAPARAFPYEARSQPTPFLAVLFSTMTEAVPLKNQGWSWAG